MLSEAVNFRKDEMEALVKDFMQDKVKSGSKLSQTVPHDQCEMLSSTIAKLCVENMWLKQELGKRDQETPCLIEQPLATRQLQEEEDKFDQQQASRSVIYKTYHLVHCFPDRRNYYEDVPRMFQGDLMSDHLRGQHSLPKNITKYLKENPHIIFAPVNLYYCACMGGRTYHGSVGYKDGKLIADSALADHEETFITLGPRMLSILKTIVSANQDRFRGYPAKELEVWFLPPYRLFFQHNKTLLKLAACSGLDESEQNCTTMLCEWFERNCREDWAEAEDLMSRKKINRKHYKKLFEPDELCMWTPTGNDFDSGVVVKTLKFPWGNNGGDVDNYTWTFNGVFRKAGYKNPLNVFPIEGPAIKEVDISSLPMYPMRFAIPGTMEKMIARGHKFWHCRTRKLVSYCESGQPPTFGQVREQPPPYAATEQKQAKSSITTTSPPELLVTQNMLLRFGRYF